MSSSVHANNKTKNIVVIGKYFVRIRQYEQFMQKNCI